MNEGCRCVFHAGDDDRCPVHGGRVEQQPVIELHVGQTVELPPHGRVVVTEVIGEGVQATVVCRRIGEWSR